MEINERTLAITITKSAIDIGYVSIAPYASIASYACTRFAAKVHLFDVCDVEPASCCFE